MNHEITQFVTRLSKIGASILKTWWDKHAKMVLSLAVALMAVVALIWLSYEFWRLLWQPAPIWPSSPTGAIDLKLRYDEVHRWFAGMPVYSELRYAVDPPASCVMLWPFIGWLAFTPAIWLWAAITVVTLVWLVYLVVQESGTNKPLERVFVALMPLSMYATGATIGNGQLIVHLLPALVAGLLLLKRGLSTDGDNVVAGALLVITLLAMLAPGGLYLFPPPWNSLYVACQVSVWTIVLIFLLNQASHEKNAKIG